MIHRIYVKPLTASSVLTSAASSETSVLPKSLTSSTFLVGICSSLVTWVFTPLSIGCGEIRVAAEMAFGRLGAERARSGERVREMPGIGERFEGEGGRWPENSWPWDAAASAVNKERNIMSGRL